MPLFSGTGFQGLAPEKENQTTCQLSPIFSIPITVRRYFHKLWWPQTYDNAFVAASIRACRIENRVERLQSAQIL